MWTVLLLSLGMLCCCFMTANAQKQRSQNRPYADYRHFHLGFHVGMHTQDLAITNSGALAEGEAVQYGTVAMYSPGFSVGIIGNWAPIIGLDIRFIPTLHLGERAITFTDLTEGEEGLHKERFGLRSNMIEFPLMIKYSARRLNNVRPYVTGGIYGSIMIGQKRNPEIRFNLFDYGLKIGFGCDFYLPFFKLSPELCFNFGLSDVITHKREDMIDDSRIRYTNALSKALGRMIILTFNFE